MAKQKLIFKGLDVYDIPEGDRPYWIPFEVIHFKTGKKILSFCTNKSLEGRFENGGDYRQQSGTCQFNLKGSKLAAKNKLRRMAFKQILSEDFGVNSWKELSDMQLISFIEDYGDPRN